MARRASPTVLMAFCGMFAAAPVYADSEREAKPTTPREDREAILRHNMRDEINAGLVGIVSEGTDYTVHLALSLAGEQNRVRVLPVAGAGASQNAKDVMFARGIDFAILQTDVLDEIKRREICALLSQGCKARIVAHYVGCSICMIEREYERNKEFRERVVHAYETWGFKGLSRELIDVLNIWARFIYGPLLDDRVRSLADGVKPGDYGRREAFRVHQALKEKGPGKVPREFVFMDRAAIGLGGVFLHLRAELNFHRLFNEAIEDFSIARVTRTQEAALARAGLETSAR